MFYLQNLYNAVGEVITETNKACMLQNCDIINRFSPGIFVNFFIWGPKLRRIMDEVERYN